MVFCIFRTLNYGWVKYLRCPGPIYNNPHNREIVSLYKFSGIDTMKGNEECKTRAFCPIGFCAGLVLTWIVWFDRPFSPWSYMEWCLWAMALVSSSQLGCTLHQLGFYFQFFIMSSLVRSSTESLLSLDYLFHAWTPLGEPRPCGTRDIIPEVPKQP